jgi:hypothetical protein
MAIRQFHQIGTTNHSNIEKQRADYGFKDTIISNLQEDMEEKAKAHGRNRQETLRRVAALREQRWTELGSRVCNPTFNLAGNYHGTLAVSI